jgi:hypothetical protein
MNSKTAELKALLDLFDKEGLVAASIEADHFSRTFTISLYPEKMTSFQEIIESEKDYPLSSGLTKTIENAGYKVIFYTSKHNPYERNPGFFLLSIKKNPGEIPV